MEKLKSFPEGTVVYSINDFHLDNGSVVFNFPTCSLAQLTRTNASEWGYVSIFKSKGLDNTVRYIDSEPAYFFDTIPDEFQQDEVVVTKPMMVPRTVQTLPRTVQTLPQTQQIVAEDSRTYVSTPKTVSFGSDGGSNFDDVASDQPITRTVDRKTYVTGATGSSLRTVPVQTVRRTLQEEPESFNGSISSLRTAPGQTVRRTFQAESFNGPVSSLRTVPVQTVGRLSPETDTLRQVTTDLIKRYKPICSEIYYSRFSVENPDDFTPVCQYAVKMNELKDYLVNLNITESIKYLRIMTREQEMGLVQTFMPTVDWFSASS